MGSFTERRMLRKLGILTSREGRRLAVASAMRELTQRIGPDLTDAFVRPEDIRDPFEIRLPDPAVRPEKDRRLRITWVTTPPGKGSGGHTTMFRMVEALEAAGHECTLALYDPYESDLGERTRIVRESWPRVRASVRGLPDGLDGADAAIATAWQTAHALARHGTSPMRRLYFVQDYEPLFFPRGAVAALAELSYHFGYRTIALGEMVAGHLRRDIGLDPDVVPFGCDTDTYSLSKTEPRSGVVFYAVPGAARRGYLLNLLALERFHLARPDQSIHAYGATRQSRLPFPAVWHGRVSPAELNALYNGCVAGLAMSFTNISLVAEEMLAAGCIPVVNDSSDARADLPDAPAAWVAPTPDAVASALMALVDAPDTAERARVASRGVRHGWAPAQAGLVRIVEEEVYGTPVSTPGEI